jgi:hypothetical protein
MSRNDQPSLELEPIKSLGEGGRYGHVVTKARHRYNRDRASTQKLICQLYL